MIFYHTSQIDYKDGVIVCIDDFAGLTTIDHRRRNQEEKEINVLLDSCRPTNVTCSRTKCIYLFDDISNCAEYARTIESVYIYKVEAEEAFGPYPMCLIGRIFKKKNSDLEKLINEYWHPTHNWRFNEFITPKMRIIKKINPTSGNLICGRNNYMIDWDIVV